MSILGDLIQAILGRKTAPVPVPKVKPRPDPVSVEPDPHAPGPHGSLPTASRFECAVWVDKVREKSGLGPLKWNNALESMAQRWARTMAGARALSHDDFKARLIADVGRVAGAENVEEGPTTPEACVALWEKSPLHLANMLGDYTHAGVGAHVGDDGVTYWCLDLAKLP